MRKVTFALMRRNLRMLVLAGIAIVVGTAFVSATFLFGNSLGDMFAQSVSAPYASATHVIASSADRSGNEDAVAASPTLETAQAIASTDGVQAVRVNGWWRATISHKGRAATSLAEPMSLSSQGSSSKAAGQMMPLHLVSGTWPKEGQIALTEASARTLKAKVGQDVRVRVAGYSDDGSASASNAKTATRTVSGIVSDPRGVYAYTNGASVLPVSAFPAASKATKGSNDIESIYVRLDAGNTSAESSVRSLLPKGWKLSTRQAAVHKQILSQSGNQDVVQVFLMIFGILALLVAALVISNTFQVIIAHRRRTLALLRAVGATKKQLYGSVVQEASVLGLVSSAIGVGLACLLMWVLTLLPEGTIHLMNGVRMRFIASAPVFVVPIVFGVVITILASLSAARQATMVTPLEALRPMEQAPTRKAGVARAVFSVLLLVGGALLAVWSYKEMTAPSISSDKFQSFLLMGIAACALLFVGLTVSAVWWMPVVMRGACWIAGKVGPASKIAGANIQRNPRRVAATGTALLIGVTLVTTIATGAASMNATAEQKLDAHFSVDVAVIAPNGLKDKDLSAMRRVKGIQHAERVGQFSAIVDRDDSGKKDALVQAVTVYALTNAQREKVLRGAGLTAPKGTAIVARSNSVAIHGLKNSQTIGLRVGSTAATTATGAYSDNAIGSSAETAPSGVSGLQSVTEKVKIARFSIPGVPDSAIIISPSDLPENLRRAATASGSTFSVIWARVDPSADGMKVMNELQDALAGAGQTQILGPIAERQEFEQQINQIMLVLVALLAVSVLIALIGVANTLSLSVIERTRESATLRAIGMTKSQLRRSLAVEALILSVTSSVVGLLVGAFFGWFGSMIVLKGAFGGMVFRFDWRMAGIILLISVITALISSVAPANRAVKTSPVEVLSEA
jgi:putative ABC transport system permease protein